MSMASDPLAPLMQDGQVILDALMHPVVPPAFVKTARNWLLFCPAEVVNVSVVEVAPEMLLNVEPPSVDTCHCTVGAGVPLAAAVKLTLAPAQTVWFTGFVVTVGGVFTVSVAAFVVAVPQVFVKTARNLFPFWPLVVVNVRVVEVAPDTLLNVAPPSVETCHWTVGEGLPDAAAVKLALRPALTF